jgi:hypothetical protein
MTILLRFSLEIEFIYCQALHLLLSRQKRELHDWKSVCLCMCICLCLYMKLEYLYLISFPIVLPIGCSQVRTNCRRSQEAPPLPSWNCCPPWNQKVPEIYRPSYSQGPIPASRPWDRPGLQVRSSLSVNCCSCSPRGQWGLLGWIVRGYQPLCHSCQACYNHAKGYSVGPSYPWGTCLGFHNLFVYLLCRSVRNET